MNTKLARLITLRKIAQSYADGTTQKDGLLGLINVTFHLVIAMALVVEELARERAALQEPTP